MLDGREAHEIKMGFEGWLKQVVVETATRCGGVHGTHYRRLAWSGAGELPKPAEPGAENDLWLLNPLQKDISVGP
jgi:hypothetical protein